MQQVLIQYAFGLQWEFTMTTQHVPVGIPLLIFDLDGTLIDSRTDLVMSVNATRERMGLGPLPAGLISSYVGRGVSVLIRRSLGASASVAALERATTLFLDYYGKHLLDNTVAYAGVSEALEGLKTRKLAVLTNKPANFSRAILNGLGIAHYFSFVYGGDSFAQKKPDPVGVFKLMADLSLGTKQTMIVGDSDTDVFTGRNAGVWTCGVTYGLAPHTLKTTPPDVLLDDLRQLPPRLKALEESTATAGSNQSGVRGVP
jgi:phosphoglycolate phosphatase